MLLNFSKSRMSVCNMERFPFNQNFRKFGTSGKWYRNFSEKFPEIPETGEFSKCKISTENSGRKVEWKENLRENFPKIWVFVARSSSVLEYLNDAVPLATGSCRKFKLDVLVEWNAPKGHLPITKSFQKIWLKSEWSKGFRCRCSGEFPGATNHLKR